MTSFQGSFDASQFQPNQGGQGHPVGKFPFNISHTECVSTKDQQGGMFVVTFTSPSGEIKTRYNLWNQNAKAVEIAHGQLSALCHATGVFKLDWQNEGAALRGARGMMEIGYQKGEEPTAEKPAGGYVEVKKVFDVNGNEPGKGPAPAAQPMQQAPQAQPQMAWPNQPAPPPGSMQASTGFAQQAAPMQQQPNGGWQPPAQQQAPQQPGWTQGAAPNQPPWANK
jgi:hypothetical protein